tara:strand:+ start:195 stop:368 length:174 start_codon:yes stop_codon:yes gene_type:complete
VRVGMPSAAATVTHITAGVFALLDMVCGGISAAKTKESPSRKVVLLPFLVLSVSCPC